MKSIKKLNRIQRIKLKHKIVRKKIFGTQKKPRLCIYRGTKNLTSQIINDEGSKTLVYAFVKGKNKNAFTEIANKISKKAKEKKNW